jgi:DegV family protein with EDD domain
MVRKEYPDRQAECFDTHLATIVQGFLVIKAARMATRGASMSEVLALLRQERRNVEFVASLETLENFTHNARINKTSSMMVSMINILTILTLGKDRQVRTMGLVSNHRKAFEKMADYGAMRMEKDRTLSVVMHADILDWADQLKQMVETRLHSKSVILTSFTPLMAVHTDLDLIGLVYHSQ